MSVPIGGVLQLAWLFFACRAAGVSLRPRMPKHRCRRETADAADPACRDRRRRGPVQPGRLDCARPGYLLGEGSISYIYYADRLNQLPLGMIGIGLGTILLPTISRLLERRRGGEGDGDPEPRHGAGAVPDPAGHGRVDRRRRADRPRPVPIRPFRRRGHGQMRLGARRILDRPALLRARQGAHARLIMPGTTRERRSATPSNRSA